jgi:hypothetical protein
MPKYSFAILRERVNSDLGEMDLPDNKTAIEQLLHYAREEAIDESGEVRPKWAAVLKDDSGETIAIRDFCDLMYERMSAG